MPTIVISPLNVINFQEGGGHFWVYMQYAQGLLHSGCEVYWMESFRSNRDDEADRALLFPFLERMKRFGLGRMGLAHRKRSADSDQYREQSGRFAPAKLLQSPG